MILHQHRDQSEWTEALASYKLQVPGPSYYWWGFQAWNTFQDSTDNSSMNKAETSLQWREYFSWLQDTTDVLPCHIYLPVCLGILDPHSRAPKKIQAMEMRCYPKILHILYKDHVTNEEMFQDSACNWTTRRLDHHTETQTAVVWSCLPFIRSGQNHLARHSERGKKTRQTLEDVGRRHQGMDKPGVRQVPEGSGEQKKIEKTGCKIICGAPTTLAIKG